MHEMKQKRRNRLASNNRLRRAKVIGAVLTAVAVVAACGSGSQAGSTEASADVVSIATYSGADREQLLLDGAKKEGELLLYTNPTGDITDAIVAAFEQKYPDVKIKVTQADSSDLARRISEESSAGRHTVDVVETTTGVLGELSNSGLLSKFSSPEESAYDPDAVRDYYVGVRESYLGLGYNTDAVKPDEVPKSLDDLLDPRWHGKINLPTSATGVRWIAALELTRGQEFVSKMAQQEIRGQNVSGRALADLIVSGEVELSPTIYNSHVSVSKGEGAPIAWQPIEPVIAVPTALAVAANSPNPHASMLYIDFALSKAGQEIYKSKGYDSARTDIGSGNNFQKIYIDTRDDYATKFPMWEEETRKILLQ
jgi:iron(III) transport system substrate-binding protein